jgi:hypothetical protein
MSPILIPILILAGPPYRYGAAIGAFLRPTAKWLDDVWVCSCVWLSEQRDKIEQWDWDWLWPFGLAYIVWGGFLLLAPWEGHSFRDKVFFALRWALMPSVVIPGGISLFVWSIFRKGRYERLVRVVVLSVAAGGALIWCFIAYHSQSPTAKCNDETYSYSRNHSGTCSHHGGVMEWYKTQQDLNEGK